MPRKREDFPLEKVTLNLYAGEFKKLQELYPRLGSGKVVRVLVHNLVRSVSERAEQQLPPPDLTLEDVDV